MAENEITVQCLPPEVLGAGTGVVPVAVEVPRGGGKSEMGTTLMVRVGCSASEVEQQLIMATLEACSGNKQKAAEILGVSLKTLYNRLAAYKEAEKA